MHNANWEKSIVRTVNKSGKTYKKIMRCYAELSTSEDLTGTSSAEEKVLHELLVEMTETPPPRSYREKAEKLPNYTIVETWVKGRNYRIDNQMKLNLEEPNDMSKLESGPRLNIQYQIEKKSHAMVLVRMKPRECPSELRDKIIDEDEIFGFSPGAVMGFIEDSLKFSAGNKRKTNIEWTIKEVKCGGSQSMDGLTQLGTAVTAPVAVGTAVTAPVAAVEIDAKVIAEQGAKVVVKKIPVIGFVCGLVFGFGRLITGDPLGAVGEVASGAASCLPGLGTAASIGIDAALIKRDFAK